MPEDGGRVWSNRFFSTADMECIRAIIRDHPGASRKRLATLVCQALDWRGANGRLREMRCRVVMLRMHEAGLFTLPPPQGGFNQAQPDRWRHHALPEPDTPIDEPVHRLPDLRISTVTAQNRKLSPAS